MMRGVRARVISLELVAFLQGRPSRVPQNGLHWDFFSSFILLACFFPLRKHVFFKNLCFSFGSLRAGVQ
jgi:hypothetical protein